MNSHSITLFVLSLLIFITPLTSYSETPSIKIENTEVNNNSNIYSSIKDISKLRIETPSLSKQKMKKIMLNNGMKVVLISDPETKLSGASLQIKTGSNDNPTNALGLAHFMEHLLFLGSEKHPEANCFGDFIATGGGTHNAFTADAATVYGFDIQNEYFDKALDIFSCMFSCPLLDPKCITSEREIVDQEHKKNLNLDNFRSYFVFKEVAVDKDHPFSLFATGDSETLANVTHDSAKEWFEANYIANKMTLVVYSNQAINDLENSIIKLFSPIQNNLDFVEKKYDCEKIIVAPSGTCINVASIQENNYLELVWELPNINSTDILSCAPKILSKAFGDEGEDSLAKILKKEDLISSLTSYHEVTSQTHSIFTIHLDLTKNGIENIETVKERCFQAINMFKIFGIPEFLSDELKSQGSLQYRFQERGNLFKLLMNYAYSLLEHPIELFPDTLYIPLRNSPKRCKELLNSLTAKDCLFITVLNKNNFKNQEFKTEKWLKTEYFVSNTSEERLNELENIELHQFMTPPRQNKFMPKDVVSIKSNKDNKKPLTLDSKLILKSNLMEVYAKNDKFFGLPKICYSITIKTPKVSFENTKNFVLASVFTELLNNYLTTVYYEASQGGLFASFDTNCNGFNVILSGFEKKSEELLKEIIQTLVLKNHSEEEFERSKNILKQNYLENINSSPLTDSINKFKEIVLCSYPSNEKKLSILENLNYDEFISFTKNVFSHVFFEVSLYGYKAEDHASSVIELLQDHFSSSTGYEKENFEQIKSIDGSNFSKPLILNSSFQSESNALLWCFLNGEYSHTGSAIQNIFMKGISKKFFDELRTQQKTAYAITSKQLTLEKHLYNIFLLQSASHDTSSLLSRLEVFFNNTNAILISELFSKSQFEQLKTVYIAELKELSNNVISTSSLIHSMIFNHNVDFNFNNDAITAVEKLDYDSFIKQITTMLLSNNVKKIAILINGTNAPKKEYKTFYSIEDAKKFVNYSK